MALSFDDLPDAPQNPKNLSGIDFEDLPDAGTVNNLSDKKSIFLSNGKLTPEAQASLRDTTNKQIGAAITGAADSASFGFGDEIAAGMGAPVGYIANQLAGNDKSLGQTYDDLLANRRAQISGAKKENPNAFTAGQFAGGLAIPGAGILSGGSLGMRVLKGAAAGGAQGTAYAYGSGEGEDSRLKMAEDAALPSALVGGLLPVAGQAISSVIPTSRNASIDVKKLGDASSVKYQAMRDAGATLNRSGINTVTYNIGKELSDTGLMNKSLHGKTMSVIEDLNADAAKGSLDLERLDQYRQLLSDVVTDTTDKINGVSKDGLKAQVAINAIDNAVDSLGASHLASGTTEAVKALNDARDLYSAKSRYKTIQNMIDNAYNTDKPNTSLRNAAANLAKSIRGSKRGWTDEEIAAINDMARRGIPGGILNFMSSKIISGIAGGAGGAVGGGVPGAIAGAAAGGAVTYPFQKAANALQEGKANAVLNAIADRPQVQQALGMSPAQISKLPPQQAIEVLNNMLRTGLITNNVQPQVQQ